jgi:CheY-like chemotaxis protein
MNDTVSTSVLIVEDDRNLNLALSETLIAYGFTTISAYNGQDALDKLSESLPDVIVCDITMPVMDGYTFLQKTRANPELRLLPFIFLTARSTSEDQRRAKMIGIEDYLSKPIDSKDLVAAIENAIQRRRLFAAEIERNMERLRSRIVGLLQHEFRTPLTFILGYAELLSGSDSASFDADELRTVADGILDGGRRLQQLIESFLLMAELQTYTQTPQTLEPVDAHSLWNDILRDLAVAAPSASGANGAAQVQLLAPAVNHTINIDVRLVDEALRRLYDYVHRAGQPPFECSIESRIPYVGLAIRCGGGATIPLPPAIPGQPSTQSSDEVETDLGLLLARTVAHLHGGRLTFEQDILGWTTLTLWLPSTEPEPEPV